MTKFVVGYDDTESSRRALARAVTLARALDAELVVASVATVTTPASGRSIGPDPTQPAAELTELGAAREYLHAQGVEARYVEAVGHPADSILAAAEEHEAEMIIVGTREVGFLQRVLGASVSDAVSHRAHCDVLIVH